MPLVVVPVLLILGSISLAVALGRALVDAMEKSKPRPRPVEGKPMSRSDRQRIFRCAFSATGLGDDWMRFLEQTAKRESNFNPDAHNKTQAEVDASKRMVDRLNGRGTRDWSGWGFGSKGWFQFLGPVVALRGGKLRFPKAQTHPDMGFDRGVSMAAALDYAGGLMKWGNFAGSWASLSVGWGNPSKMGNAAAIASAAQKMEDRAAQLGWPRGWAMEQASSPGSRSQSQMAALAKAADFAAQGCS
jgi:hypothetical protein